MTTTIETKTIHKILVANRAEIAIRVMRTCRELGIRTVAVFSDADANAPHVRFADEAVRVGPAPSIESYLCIDKMIAAAQRTGADAIHPGYGFLAENAEFAQACADAGILFIGPSAEAIQSMGSKREAKKIVDSAGVPVIPGYDGADQNPAVLIEKAREMGCPVLVKASAGGGGKGMRVVREEGELEAAIAAARREAASSFGDDTLLIERYVDEPRHIEFQILGDQHGNMVHVFERECSIQRRHQKIIEESPSVALDADLRARMGEAAVKVGQSIGYHNAGTVEFILAPDGAFYFLEVNTRLQVEHPVTECITGLDLVREQIRVAEGHPLSFTQDDLEVSGHAIECRIYAEDPDNGFLPCSGTLVDWHMPADENVRIDGAAESGLEVSVHYDPLLAKIIVHRENRGDAIRSMASALGRLSAQGIATNRSFLIRVLAHAGFHAGTISTHFVDEHSSELQPETLTLDAYVGSLVAATLHSHRERVADQTILPALVSGYRNNRNCDAWASYAVGDATHRILYRDLGGDRYEVSHGNEEVESLGIWTVMGQKGPELELENSSGLRSSYRVVADGPVVYVHDGSQAFQLDEIPRFPEPDLSAQQGGLTAPMPGKVVRIEVAQGEAVEKGQVLAIMEAMKMEHSIASPEDGTVQAIPVAQGDVVDTGQVLVVLAESA